MFTNSQIAYSQELHVLNAHLKANVTQLSVLTGKLRDVNKHLQGQLTQLEVHNKQQDEDIENNGHFEGGQVFCGQSSNTWNNVMYLTPSRGGSWLFNTRSIQVVFKKSYPSPPLVYVALQVGYLA